MAHATLTFQYALLCDDVRREDNGKLIVIGMYGGDIRLPTLPAHMPVSLVAAFDAVERQKEKLYLTVSLNGAPIIKGELSVEIVGIGLAHIVFPAMPLTFDKEGTLIAVIKTSDGVEHRAWKGEVRLQSS